MHTVTLNNSVSDYIKLSHNLKKNHASQVYHPIALVNQMIIVPPIESHWRYRMLATTGERLRGKLDRRSCKVANIHDVHMEHKDVCNIKGINVKRCYLVLEVCR